jgi:DNA-binding Lrp family transcriptional regulator
MEISKNEKKCLKLLLENARISDSDIAKKLRISSQAVGKIRKKLEKTIINSYTLNLNLNKLNIKLFVIAHAKLTEEGFDKGELEIEQKLLNEPNIISIYRLPSGCSTHIILYGFKDMNDMDKFFHSQIKREAIHKYIENKEIFTFSNHSIIKNNPTQLFHKTIEEEGEQKKIIFNELESFKKKLNERSI